MSPATVLSAIRELPHLILLFRDVSFRPFCAVLSQSESFAISTDSSFISTPKRLFSRIEFSIFWNKNPSPNNLPCNSSIYPCSAIRNSSAWFKKAPLPQAGSQMVIPNSQLRYCSNLSCRDLTLALFCLPDRSCSYSSSTIPNPAFFCLQRLPTVLSTIYLVMYFGV